MRTSTIPAYIAAFPSKNRKALQEMYDIIRGAVPKEAEETMGYGIPTFKLHGNLVHFGGFQNHIGFFPGPAAIVAFRNELKKYKTSKGTIQFPYGTPLPAALIRNIIALRVRQNACKDQGKARILAS